jgi:GNAT superfamily N-acetyltransferase
MYELKPAVEADHPAILKLWHQGWHDAHAHLVPPQVLVFRTPDYFALWLKQATDRFYVVKDDSLSGFVSIRGAEVVKLYVDAEARGSGVAQILLSGAERLLAERGVRRAELFCTAGNLRAERFYERQGWTLSRSFDDALWLPDGVPGRFVVKTHGYSKVLA